MCTCSKELPQPRFSRFCAVGSILADGAGVGNHGNHFCIYLELDIDRLQLRKEEQEEPEIFLSLKLACNFLKEIDGVCGSSRVYFFRRGNLSSVLFFCSVLGDCVLTIVNLEYFLGFSWNGSGM